MEKIVIFTGSLSYSVRKGIVNIVNAIPDLQILVAHHSPQKSISTLLRNQCINIEKNGWRWIPYQVSDLYQRVIKKWFPKITTTTNNPGSQYDWNEIIENTNIQYYQCGDLHQPETLAKVKAFRPDLGISLAAPILKDPLFSIPSNGTINLHKGKVPFYRGMPPAFWELWNREKEVGCTIHKVESSLDTGAVLVEDTVAVAKYSTVKGLQLALDEMGVTLTLQAIDLLKKGNPGWKQQAGIGKTYTKPTLKQQAILNKRLATTHEQGFIKHFIKELIFFCYVYLYRPIPRHFLAKRNQQRIVVILYHRVNDDLRDSVTVGIEQFDRHMTILERDYTVVSIEDIVDGKAPRNTTRPLIAVTFDDGYLDNYENAVPILLRHNIPASFFVSTGIIGTKNGFAHDLSKLGRALPNMTWEHIADMYKDGFVIGSHTVTHINCAQADPEKVREEIEASKKALQEKLGLNNIIFSYPFGKREDMNAGMLDFVKKVGYSACVSAYGGRNDNEVDRFNILRSGVSYNLTDMAFKARLEGFVGFGKKRSKTDVDNPPIQDPVFLGGSATREM